MRVCRVTLDRQQLGQASSSQRQLAQPGIISFRTTLLPALRKLQVSAPCRTLGFKSSNPRRQVSKQTILQRQCHLSGQKKQSRTRGFRVLVVPLGFRRLAKCKNPTQEADPASDVELGTRRAQGCEHRPGKIWVSEGVPTKGRRSNRFGEKRCWVTFRWVCLWLRRTQL